MVCKNSKVDYGTQLDDKGYPISAIVTLNLSSQIPTTANKYYDSVVWGDKATAAKTAEQVAEEEAKRNADYQAELKRHTTPSTEK